MRSDDLFESTDVSLSTNFVLCTLCTPDAYERQLNTEFHMSLFSLFRSKHERHGLAMRCAGVCVCVRLLASE